MSYKERRLESSDSGSRRNLGCDLVGIALQMPLDVGWPCERMGEEASYLVWPNECKADLADSLVVPELVEANRRDCHCDDPRVDLQWKSDRPGASAFALVGEVAVAPGADAEIEGMNERMGLPRLPALGGQTHSFDVPDHTETQKSDRMESTQHGMHRIHGVGCQVEETDVAEPYSQASPGPLV